MSDDQNNEFIMDVVEHLTRAGYVIVIEHLDDNMYNVNLVDRELNKSIVSGQGFTLFHAFQSIRHMMRTNGMWA